MIKVNLLKNAGKKQAGESTVISSGFKPNLEGAMGGNSALGKRIGILLVPFVLAYLYAWNVESGLKTTIQNLTQQSATVDTQLDGLKPELEIIEQLKVEKNKLSAQVNAIKELSRKRYAHSKVLDALQTLIPEKAWIIKLKIQDQSISIEGRATEDTVISSFMQNLEESVYFSNVTWVDSREVTEPQGVVKSFNIRFNMEHI